MNEPRPTQFFITSGYAFLMGISDHEKLEAV